MAITAKTLVHNDRTVKVRHPIHLLECSSCDTVFYVHDNREGDPESCRCGGELGPSALSYEASRSRPHTFVGPERNLKVRCKKCKGRSIRKVLKATGGFCAKCKSR